LVNPAITTQNEGKGASYSLSYQYKVVEVMIRGNSSANMEIERHMNQCASQGWEYYNDITPDSYGYTMLVFRQAATSATNSKEPTEFRVVLTSSGANKIAVIKAVREVTDLGLKEAKDLVDAAPSPIITTSSENEALSVARKLKEVGANVEFLER
jgi:large subunit ribosomal protein L7/L12